MEAISVKFDVWRIFHPPFKCICCGKEISKKQFIFSCLCGYCDLGRCYKSNSGFMPYEQGHNLKLWKVAEIDVKRQVIEELK